MIRHPSRVAFVFVDQGDTQCTRDRIRGTRREWLPQGQTASNLEEYFSLENTRQNQADINPVTVGAVSGFFYWVQIPKAAASLGSSLAGIVQPWLVLVAFT